jgi:hypothetical protein
MISELFKIFGGLSQDPRRACGQHIVEYELENQDRCRYRGFGFGGVVLQLTVDGFLGVFR